MKLIGAAALVCASSFAQTLLPNGWTIHPAGTQVAVDTFPMSAVATPDGKYLLVMNAGAHAPSISVIDVAAGKELGRTPVADAWLGLTMTKAGDKVYVGGGSRAAVFEFTFSNGALTPGRTFPVVVEKDRTAQDFVGDVRFSPDGRLLYVANVHRDSVVVMNPQSGLILSRVKTGRRPYRILFHPSGKTFYVSTWADGSIGQYNVSSGERLANFRLAPHPLDMLWLDGGVEGQPEIKARIFVAAANTNSVYVMGATETGDLSKIETVNLATNPRQPLGMTPSALALSADKKSIYAVCSDANAVAVIEPAGGDVDRSGVKGFLPTGWYPTVAVAFAGGRLAVVNGRSGSVQLMDAPDEAKLAAMTKEVAAGSAYTDEKQDAAGLANSPVRAGGPIKHVVYVVRDAGAGGANRERLAKEFVTLENFVSPAENRADGMSWAMAGLGQDYAVRLGANSEAGRRKTYDYEGQDPSTLPPAGYLWNAAAQAGVTMRNYGFQVHNREKATADGEQVDRVYDPALTASTDMEYRGLDASYGDVERAKEFADEVKDFAEVGEMPALLLVRIGSDDAALGVMADAVTKSKFWNETAMFVVDASGAGEMHKGSALVVSPLAKRGVDATAYNTLSVLRTVEIILGLHPMTMFDAAAAPMYGAFGGR